MGKKKKKIKRHRHEATILDAVADGVFTVDEEWRVTSFNSSAEKMTGVSRDKAIGRHCWDVFRTSICEGRCALASTMKSGKSIRNKSIYIVNSKGKRVPVSLSTALLRNKAGKIVGGVETFRDLSRIEALRRELSGRKSFEDMVGKDHEMLSLYDVLPQVSQSDANVLIHGESGTGKELLARAIHNLSPRKKKPFVIANCSALPELLLEAELFGHKKGAFPGATCDKPGRLARATGGTLFLDELAAISPSLQVKLLRLLQEKTYDPLGATRPRKADCRIVCATSADLSSLVQSGGFREDLYYRIKVVRLDVPPLRDRRGDIPLLARHFLTRLEHIYARGIEEISPNVLNTLLDHRFPGNVRELENVVEHAYVLCTGNTLLVEHLPRELRPTSVSSTLPAASLEEVEGRFLLRTLERNEWNRSTTAKALGIHPSTLWRKLKRLGIPLPPADGRSKH